MKMKIMIVVLSALCLMSAFPLVQANAVSLETIPTITAEASGKAEEFLSTAENASYVTTYDGSSKVINFNKS